jgi:hypothetical protein
MISFGASVKTELCRIQAERTCCAAAESYGALLLGNTFNTREIRIITSHAGFAGRLPSLFSKAFGFCPDLPKQPENLGKWFFSVTSPEQIRKVRDAYGYGMKDDTVLRLNNAVLEEDCCQAAFWRGAFCAGGTATDPEKKYLLEIVTPHRVLARQLRTLLSESGPDASAGERSGAQVLALKASDMIEDFLVLIGAPVAAMAVMQAKLEKEIRNSVNRRVNCDTANLDKTLAAAERLRNVITKLERSGKLERLDDAMKETARARLLHPEDSLAELAEQLRISKSCLNHRLRKLTEMAEGEKQ